MENLKGKVVFIFAGYKKEMEKFFTHNPGIPGRLPYTFQFEDFSDVELEAILVSKIVKRFNGKMKLESISGRDANYVLQILAGRLGQGRGRDGFANARDVENMLSWVHTRQSKRIDAFTRQEPSAQSGAYNLLPSMVPSSLPRWIQNPQTSPPDEYLFKKEDLLGPDPSVAFNESQAWKDLKAMVGLAAVKQSVENLIDTIRTNSARELEGLKPLRCNLNKIFLGSPGTGKTTVARLYGQILVDLGLLSNGEVVMKTPADFIGSALGQSENNTKAIFEYTKGKVLVIDEAYQLGTLESANEPTDKYKSAVIDTIVSEVQDIINSDRCVILVGYKDKMEKMIQNGNEGLSRRFPLSDAFEFEDYTKDELLQIWRKKVNDRGMQASQDVETVALEVLERQRHKLNFGNAGEVDNLLDSAQSRYQARIKSQRTSTSGANVQLEPVDIDPEFDRVDRAETNARELFQGVVALDEIVHKIETWQKIAINLKNAKGDPKMDPRDRIPFSFLFKGPPGI
jgi:Cdc6-like AAA superfamily ATPase